MRWKRFVQAEEDAFLALVAAFTKATGVPVTVVSESLDDVQPKASVAANTGQGPDIFWGLYSLPHLFAAKCMDVTDVADYLGKKYGGWVPSAVTYGKSGNRWIAIPVGYNANVINYRQSMIEKAGFKEIPKDTAGFMELMKGLKAKSVPGGFALGRASGDGNAWVHWCLWAHRRQPGRRQGQGDHQLARDRQGARVREGAVDALRARLRGVERFLQQQGVPREPDLAHQQRRVDLRRRQGQRRARTRRRRRSWTT